MKNLYDESERIVTSVRSAYKSKEENIINALKYRKKETRKLNKGVEPCIDAEYFCETCGSHSHKCDPVTGYCFICNTDNWEPEKENRR